MNIKEKYKGLSFADIAEKIGSKYKNRDNDPIAMRSFKQEINDLKNLQEAYRLKEQLKNTTSKQAVNSDNLPMAFNGLDLTKPLEFLTRDVQQFNVDAGNKLFDFRTQDLNKLSLPTLPNTTQIQTTTQQGTPTSVPDIVEPTKKTGKEKLKEFMDNPYNAMTLGKGIEGLGKGLMLAGGYDKFDPITNPNQQEALDLIRSQRVNDEALRNEMIAGREAALANLSNVRSTAVQQAAQQNVFDTTTTQLGRAELQTQGLRNQLSSQMASALLQTGQQDVAAQERARQLNIASKAGYQQSLQNMLESVGATGEEITQFEQGIATNAFVSNLLATGNFELDTTCLEDYQRGKSVSSNCIKAKADSTTNTGVNRNEALASTNTNTTTGTTG
jgi:hypothetical protein